MSRSRAARPLIRYSLWPDRKRRRQTTTSPGLVASTGLSVFFLRLFLMNSGSARGGSSTPDAPFCSPTNSLFPLAGLARGVARVPHLFLPPLPPLAPSSAFFPPPSIPPHPP